MIYYRICCIAALKSVSATSNACFGLIKVTLHRLPEIAITIAIAYIEFRNLGFRVL